MTPKHCCNGGKAYWSSWIFREQCLPWVLLVWKGKTSPCVFRTPADTKVKLWRPCS